MRKMERIRGASYPNLRTTNHGHLEKTQKNEVNTKTPKARKQRQSQQQKEKGKIRSLQQITKEKKKEIKGKEKEKHTSKKCNTNWKRRIAGTKVGTVARTSGEEETQNNEKGNWKK